MGLWGTKKRTTEWYSYDEVYALFYQKQKPESAQIETQATLDASIESGETKEKILRNDIESLTDLNAAMDVNSR